MVDLTESLIKQWKANGIGVEKIEVQPLKLNYEQLLALDGDLFFIRFKIKENYTKVAVEGDVYSIWDNIVKYSQEVKEKFWKMTFNAGLDKKRVDEFGYFSHADCYIEYHLNIDLDNISEKLLDEMTKPEPKQPKPAAVIKPKVKTIKLEDKKNG